jgi:xanthine dehydrogenase large subunit
MHDSASNTPLKSTGPKEGGPQSSQISREDFSKYPCHDSAISHVMGTSLYVEDLASVRGEVYLGLVTSPIAYGELVELDFTQAQGVAGYVAHLTAQDLCHNSWGPIVQDQPVLATKELHYIGEPIAVIAAETREAAFEAVGKVRVKVQKKEPLLSIEEAQKAQSYFLPEPLAITTGELEKGFSQASHVLDGTFTTKGQDHFYLESQSAIAHPGEMDEILVHSSTQHPSEVQHTVAHILGLPLNKVVCMVKRMGGGFGGKESQATHYAALCALAAHRLRRVARLHLTKDEDMCWTGKRHGFRSDFKVGFNEEGRIIALQANLFSDGGAYLDLSQPVLQRAMLHVDNAYFIPHMRVEGQICRTHLPPNTAFRGFGGPQGVALIESIMEDIAFHLKMDPLQVRLANLYGSSARNKTHYGQTITHNTLPSLFDQIVKQSNYHERRREISAFNLQNDDYLRSLSLTPVKFGISFTVKHLNQGNALVNVHRDGTIQVSTGATEMGQGVQIKIAGIVAEVFGLPVPSVKIMPTSTEKNHNTSATAASSGSDINGFAAFNGAWAIRARLAAFACYLCDTKPAPDPFSLKKDLDIDEWLQNTERLNSVYFQGGQVVVGSSEVFSIGFADLVEKAYLFRISLGQYGYYKTPSLFFDREKGSGHPFLYFTNGVAASEVQIDRLTGEVKVLRTDILMDLGRPLNPAIDRGQVVGAFVQGLGWVCLEDLRISPEGSVLTHSPTTYKIPNIHDIPREFNISFLENSVADNNIRGSKAVGEPPLLLAISVWTAIKQGLQEHLGQPLTLPLPATQEIILPILLRKKPYGTSPPQTSVL